MYKVSKEEWDRIFPPTKPYFVGTINGIRCIADPNAEPRIVRLLNKRDAAVLYPDLLDGYDPSGPCMSIKRR